MPDTGKYGLLILCTQTGKFADANICVVDINDKATSATFQNSTALFIISAPTGTKLLTAKSLKKIGLDGHRTIDRWPISMDETFSPQYTISINGSDEDGKYYVALTRGVNLSDLSFEVEYEISGTGAVKGIPTSKIADLAGAAVSTTEYNTYNAVAAGTAYTIDSNNWHEYVEVGGHKWATMNVGAEKPEDAGDYFMWGAVEVAYEKLDGNKKVKGRKEHIVVDTLGLPMAVAVHEANLHDSKGAPKLIERLELK